MRRGAAIVVLAALLGMAGCASARAARSDAGAPALLTGEFRDDYRGRFTISDSVWFQQPRNRFRIVEWHVAEQYLIAQNAPDDPTAPGRWTRIDWVELDGMPPFRWGFCLTEYQAPSRDAARATPPASRSTPKTGCNGYPFTRMRREVPTLPDPPQR